MRAAGPPRLANPPGTADRRVRLHRGLLQPPTPPLDPGLRQPRHLRAPAHLTSTCRIATVSTKPGQLQTFGHMRYFDMIDVGEALAHELAHTYLNANGMLRTDQPSWEDLP